MNRPRPPAPNLTGTSLLEVLICMAIMSLVLGLSVADMSRHRHIMALKAGSRTFASALRAAQAEAVAKRMYCAVRLYDGTVPGMSPAFQGYGLYECQDSKGERPVRWISGPHALPSGTRFISGGDQTFVFGPVGKIVSRGINHKTVRIESSDGVRSSWHDITVLTATGRVKVKPLQSDG